MHRIGRLAGLIALAWLIGSCGGSSDSITGPPPPPPPTTATVAISTDTATLVPAATLPLSATAKDVSGQQLQRTFSWTSADPAKATVSPAGVVTGVSPGTVNITATVDGKSGTAIVTVLDGGVVSSAGGVLTLQSGSVQITVPQDALTSKTNLSVAPFANATELRVIKATAFEFGPSGTTFAKPVVLKIKYDPANLAPGTEQSALELYSLTSSGSQVVAGSTVDLTSKVVTAEVSHFSAYALLTPSAVALIAITGPPERPVLNGTSSLYVTESEQFVATLHASDGQVLSNRAITWVSADPTIASITPGGLLAALKPGLTTISASAGGITSIVAVTVALVPVSSVMVSLASPSISVGQTTQTSAVLKDAHGNVLQGRALTWASSNPLIASVAGDGMVSALGVGSTSITATSEGQSGSVLLTVTPPVATSFGLVGGIPPVVPIPLSAGSAITPALVLRATTQSGIPVPGVRIVASISPAGATLAGSTSVSTDATGTGTFSNLVVNGAPGSYALMFTADGIQGAINFAVVLSAPSSGDATPPQVVSLSFWPTTVDVSANAAVTTATLHVTDAGSGASVVTVTIQSPAGTAFINCMGVLQSGAANDGIWSSPCTIPAQSAAGTWSVSAIQTRDVVGNNSFIYSAAAAALSPGITVVSPSGDASPPQVLSLGFSPSTVDVGAGPALTTATSHVTDAGSGTKLVTITILSPAGTAVINCMGVLQSGTINDGIWSSPCTIPAQSAVGTWSVSSIQTQDVVGNNAFTSGAAAAAFSPGVTVVPHVSVADVSVTLESTNVVIGSSTRASAVLKDANGNVLTGRALSWISDNTSVASVSAAGAVSAVGVGTANIAATSEGRTGSAALNVTAAGPDLTPPSIVGLTVSPLTVDVTTSAQTVTATAHITDAGRGVIGLDFILTAPSGGIQAGCQTRVLASGTSADGTWTCTATIPQGSMPGDWVIAVNGWDAIQNMQGLRTTDLAALGFPTKVTVVSQNADLTPPSIVGLTVSPVSVDVTTGAQTIAATAHITDAGRGVTGFDFILTAPSGGIQASCQTRTILSGTASDGLWKCITTIPLGSMPGDWIIAVNGWDAAQNMQGLRTAELTALGFPTKVTVLSQNADTTPPSIVGLTVAPLTVDVTTSAQTVTATAHITDAGRGVIGLDFILTAPSGGIQAGCQTRVLASGTSADGTWTCTATIPQGSMPGDWVIAVNGWDAIQNMQGLRTTDLTALGFSTKVTVISGAVPVATGFAYAGGLPLVIPIGVTSGGTISPTPAFQLVDANSASVAKAGVQFTANISPAGATLSNAAVITDASGKATFSNLTVSGTPGLYDIAYSATGIGGVISFQIKLAAAPVGDVTPPTVLSLSFSPATVDVSTGAATSTVSMHITDAGSGVQNFFFLQLNSPAGTNAYCSAYQLKSGTEADGIWTCTITIGASAAAGLWTIGDLQVRDHAGNLTEISGAAASALSSGLTVVSSSADLTPPTVHSLTFSPTTVDVSTGGAISTVSMHITDAGSGTQNFFFLQLNSPTGTYAYCSTYQLQSGAEADGVWICTMPIGANAAAGLWTIGDLQVRDHAGNLTELTGPAASALSSGLTVVSTSADLTPPTVLSLSFSPATVDVSTGAATSTVSMHITDAGSGVQNFFFLQLNSPAGTNAYCSAYQLKSGTEADGIWTCTITIGASAAAGLWTIGDLQVRDHAGNLTEISGAAASALSSGLTVVSSSADLTPPVLASFALSPTTIDVSTTAATVAATMRVTDSGSGTQQIVLSFQSPIGTVQSCFPTLTSGTKNDGIWQCTLTFPVGSAPGTWRILQLRLEDTFQSRQVTTADVAALSGPTTITVTSANADVTPPVLASFALSPTTIDVSTTAATVAATMRVTDSGSGTQQIVLSFQSPIGTVQSCFPTLTSGTRNDGTWQCTLTFTVGSAPGTWSILQLRLEDAFQSRQVTTADVAALGGPTTITVLSANADLTPPVLASFALSPTTIDVSTAGATVAATMRVTDSGSGTQGIVLSFQSPIGTVESCFPTLTSGTKNDGTWQCTLTFPVGSAPGTWSILQLRLEDAFQSRQVTTADVAALGGPTTITVLPY